MLFEVRIKDLPEEMRIDLRLQDAARSEGLTRFECGCESSQGVLHSMCTWHGRLLDKHAEVGGVA